MELSTIHLNDTNDCFITKYNIYDKNGRFVETRNIYDTIPSLGKSIQKAYDKDDNEISVAVHNEYEFFVTLK